MIATLQQGELSAPFKVDAAMHIVRKYLSLLYLQIELEQQLKKESAESEFNEKLDELEDLVFNAESLQQMSLTIWVCLW